MLDMDFALEAWVGSLIELNKVEWMLGRGEKWKPGSSLKVLLAGYNGTRNTGSDVRVEEIARQVRRILGPENIDLSVLTQNFDFTRGYFGDARQVHLPDVYPPFLHSEVGKNHGVIACEGSMFKSKFASALTNMMIGALGIAAAQNKLSVAYGGEAGAMDPFLRAMCHRFCRDSLIVTRNPESQEVLAKLGISSLLGTDTAWTFEPLGSEYGTKALLDAGWDGQTPVLAICPINPFFWPVRPSLSKWVSHSLFGAHERSYYRTIYFHRSGREVDTAYDHYISALATGVGNYRKDQAIFPIVIAMEMLDIDACRRISEKLDSVPIFSSDRYTMYELVSILRASHRMISSRYHAIVTSMPAGVPAVGITMDERIRNIMHELGQDHLLMSVDDAEMEDKIPAALRALDGQAEQIRRAMGRVVARNLRTMAQMGVYLEEEVVRTYPDFPIRQGVLSWEDYLPPLGPCLRRLVEKHESAVA